MRLEDLVKEACRTRLLYLEDSYAKTFNSKVVRAAAEKRKDVYLILDRTIFHPKSGGQPSDEGFIIAPTFRVHVKKVMAVDGVIVHWGEAVQGEAEEIEVQGEINWPSRYLYMRRHTAGHLLDHCLNTVTGLSVETVSSWLGDPCYVSYRGDPPSMDLTARAVSLGNKMIERGAEVKVETISYTKLVEVAPNAPNIYRLPPLEAYRTVTIDGCNPIPCAGTHVKDVGEIGHITLNRVEAANSEFKIYYDVQKTA